MAARAGGGGGAAGAAAAVGSAAPPGAGAAAEDEAEYTISPLHVLMLGAGAMGSGVLLGAATGAVALPQSLVAFA